MWRIVGPRATQRPSTCSTPPCGIGGPSWSRKKSGRPSANPTGRSTGGSRWWWMWMCGSLLCPELPHAASGSPSRTCSPTRTRTLPACRCATIRYVPVSASSSVRHDHAPIPRCDYRNAPTAVRARVFAADKIWRDHQVIRPALIG